MLGGACQDHDLPVALIALLERVIMLARAFVQNYAWLINSRDWSFSGSLDWSLLVSVVLASAGALAAFVALPALDLVHTSHPKLCCNEELSSSLLSLRILRDKRSCVPAYLAAWHQSTPKSQTYHPRPRSAVEVLSGHRTNRAVVRDPLACSDTNWSHCLCRHSDT